MLPAQNRMRSSGDFRATIKHGVRGKASSLMLHLQSSSDAEQADQDSTLVGFVVPKTVGNAVVRNRLTRQLRHLMRERIEDLNAGGSVVIRVFPPARGRTYDELRADLDKAWDRAARARG